MTPSRRGTVHEGDGVCDPRAFYSQLDAVKFQYDGAMSNHAWPVVALALRDRAMRALHVALVLTLGGCSYGLCQPSTWFPADDNERCDRHYADCAGASPRDPADPQDAATRAASGCLDLASCLQVGWRDHPPDHARAIRIYETQCAASSYMACRAGIVFADVRLHDIAKGDALAERACANEATECAALGDRYLHRPAGVAPDPARARAAFERACAARLTNACYSLQGTDAGATD